MQSLGQNSDLDDCDDEFDDRFEDGVYLQIYGFTISMTQHTSSDYYHVRDVIERVDPDTLLAYEREMLWPASAEMKRTVLPIWLRYIEARRLVIRLVMAQRTRHQQREGYRAFLRARLPETRQDVEVPPVPYAARPRPPSAPTAPPA